MPIQKHALFLIAYLNIICRIIVPERHGTLVIFLGLHTYSCVLFPLHCSYSEVLFPKLHTYPGVLIPELHGPHARDVRYIIRKDGVDEKQPFLINSQL
jgi:hypothetical protein